MLDVDTYYSRCRDDIATASEVELASYMYDNLSLHKLLLKRLCAHPQGPTPTQTGVLHKNCFSNDHRVGFGAEVCSLLL